VAERRTQKVIMSAQLDHATLVDVMNKMAAGEGAAVAELVDAFGGHLAKSVGGILKSMGRSDLARNSADMDYLVWTAAIVVFDRAGRWDPRGSRPWVWAHRSIRAEVVSWMGHPRVVFDPRFHVSAGCDTGPAGADISLRSLASSHDEIACWLAAVEDVANDRDQRVHLEYQTQKHLGDRSPANTVASMFDLSPANVRQIDKRVRLRLAAHQFAASEIAPALVG